MHIRIDSVAAAFDENSLGVPPQERLRQLIDQIEGADQGGLDAFGVGEHHRRRRSVTTTRCSAGFLAFHSR
jgi:alkanesulfonate monooxygenase SsuD/methylene tetrahydromethanopterin reductase-like flavin-dependent oxidoreductase (luciferase family)